MIKPIETVYNGYRFRSRLEARWAVFFDALKIKYLYEPQGFELSDGTMYLPDFYLPDQGTFFEVKGEMQDADLHKIQQFLDDSNKPMVVGYDNLEFQATDYWWYPEDGYSFADRDRSVLARCRTCGGLYFMGINGSFECRCCGAYDGDNGFETLGFGERRKWPYRDHCSEGFRSALEKATQARFEHGERPEVNR